MSIKQVVLKRPESDLVFFFPSVFDNKAIIDAVRHIKSGNWRNWVRAWGKCEVEVTSIPEMPSYESAWKYIVLYKKDSGRKEHNVCKEKYMIVFPTEIDHDRFLEMAQVAVFESDDIGFDPINCHSAGFVGPSGVCQGTSESIGVSSHKGDTELFRLTFKSPK